MSHNNEQGKQQSKSNQRGGQDKERHDLDKKHHPQQHGEKNKTPESPDDDKKESES